MELDGLEKFYSTHSKFYDLTRPLFLFSRKRALSMLDFNENDKVLDLACGTGLNIPHITRTINKKNIVGVDYSESMLAIARIKFQDIKFIKGDVSSYESEETFDKIVCTYSLSMIERWQETIQNVRKHLVKNGVFLVLDFHSWNGAIKPFYSVFRSWLKMHGVDSNRDYLPELRRNFGDAQKKIINSGYNQIIIAKHPKSKVPELKGGAK